MSEKCNELVSIIIPAYNAARFIEETLQSVFAQTYPNYQVIVVNDGSPDTVELEQLLKPYVERIVYLKQQNKGLAGARNTGLSAAKGSLVALLDSDDKWEPNYLEEQVRFLHEHPEYDLVYCNARFFGESIYAGMEYMKVCPSQGPATAAAVISRRCHVFVAVTARTQALASVGFDESLRSCEDFDCWIRFLAAGYKIGYHDHILVHYRKHGESLSANSTRMAEYNIRVLTKSLALWPSDTEEAKLLQIAKASKTAELDNLKAKQALRDQDFATACRYFKAANEFYKSPKLSIVIALMTFFPSLVRMSFLVRGAFFPAHRQS